MATATTVALPRDGEGIPKTNKQRGVIVNVYCKNFKTKKAFRKSRI